jgi:hypothetical protein
MKIKDYKCKCGHNDFFFANKGNQTGIYCSYCGKWFKWADKDEQNLIMNQELVLDKIRAEIEELDRYYDNDYFSSNNCPMYKCNEVLQVIDKYKAESEE